MVDGNPKSSSQVWQISAQLFVLQFNLTPEMLIGAEGCANQSSCSTYLVNETQI
jgi:hypothetical protein